MGNRLNSEGCLDSAINFELSSNEWSAVVNLSKMGQIMEAPNGSISSKKYLF